MYSVNDVNQRVDYLINKHQKFIVTHNLNQSVDYILNKYEERYWYDVDTPNYLVRNIVRMKLKSQGLRLQPVGFPQQIIIQINSEPAKQVQELTKKLNKQTKQIKRLQQRNENQRRELSRLNKR